MGIKGPAYGLKEVPKTERAKLISAAKEFFEAIVVPDYLGFYARFLKEAGGKFLAGDHPTVADCFVLPQLMPMRPTLAKQQPDLVEWLDRMLALPALQKRYGSAKL